MAQEKSGNILYVLNVLKKYSDSAHILSRCEIEDLIKKEYGVTIERKTLCNYIKLLKNKFNIDISDYNDNGIGYYYIKDIDSEFEEGELRTIIDTFSYATFIDDRTSKEIIDKCRNILNVHERKKYLITKYIQINTKQLIVRLYIT